MTTRHLVDPDLVPMLEQFPTLELTREMLPQIRASFDQMMEQAAAMLPDFPDIEVTERRVPGPVGAPDVRVLVYIPKHAPRPQPGPHNSCGQAGSSGHAVRRARRGSH